MNELYLGIDLGGTKIEAVLLDAQGTIWFRERVASPATDYSGLLQAVYGLCQQADQVAGTVLPVGIGTPGAVSPLTGYLKNSNTVCLNGKNLLKDFAEALARPVRLQNDANCFVLSEAVDGAAREYRSVFGVIIGTGTGGGIVIDKKVLEGAHAIAGEWGHNPMPWLQPYDKIRSCYCGQSGCIETFLSGPGFAANARAQGFEVVDSHDIVARAKVGDAIGQQLLEQYCQQLARGLASVINVLDPDAIVLGGGMSNIEAVYQRVPQILPQYVFSDAVETPLLKPQFGDSSGVRGAAWLWK